MRTWNALIPVVRLLRRRRSLILAYHGVGDSPMVRDPEFLQVRTAAFRAQVEVLLSAGFEFVTAAEFAHRAAGGEPPPGLATLSFDDGMEDNHSIVLPILQELGVPATVYVTTGMIGKPNPWMTGGHDRMMTNDELLALASAGIELGAHTVTHPNMETLDYATCAREVNQSRDCLAALTGRPVRTFAYPYCSYGPAALRAVRDAGFEAALTCHGRGSWEPLEMKRVMLTGKDGLVSFALKLCGAYGPLMLSGPGRRARAVTRRTRRSARAWSERRMR